jgi:hypothetical protein
LLGISCKHVTAIARQRPLYYCVCVCKSICFSPLSLFIKKLYEITMLCVCVCNPPIVATQRLGKHVPAAMNTLATIEELLDATFSLRCMCIKGKQAISSSHNFFFFQSCVLSLSHPAIATGFLRRLFFRAMPPSWIHTSKFCFDCLVCFVILFPSGM